MWRQPFVMHYFIRLTMRDRKICDMEYGMDTRKKSDREKQEKLR